MLTEFGLGDNDGGQLRRACATSSVMSGGAAPPTHEKDGYAACLFLKCHGFVVGAAGCVAVTVLS